MAGKSQKVVKGKIYSLWFEFFKRSDAYKKYWNLTWKQIADLPREDLINDPGYSQYLLWKSRMNLYPALKGLPYVNSIEDISQKVSELWQLLILIVDVGEVNERIRADYTRLTHYCFAGELIIRVNALAEWDPDELVKKFRKIVSERKKIISETYPMRYPTNPVRFKELKQYLDVFDRVLYLKKKNLHGEKLLLNSIPG